MTLRTKWEEFKVATQPKIKEWKFMFKRIRESPLSMLGISIILGFVILALLAPVIAPPPPGWPDPFKIPSDVELSKVRADPTPPSLQHPFGTTGTVVTGTHYDIYYGCIWGTITAFRIGITTVVIAVIIGIIVGVVAGYYGGIVDEALMRFTDIIIAFPGLILAMALVIAVPDVLTLDITLILTVILGLTLGFALLARANVKITLILLAIFSIALIFTLFNPFIIRQPINKLDKVLIALWLIGWPGYARVVRGEVLRIKNEDFIEAAKACGASDLRVITKHIIPNTVYPILIMASLDTGSIVLTAAALSFLGLGAPPDFADWGQIIQTAQNYMAPQSLVANMHLFLIPGIFIFTFVLGWNLLGDAVRDVLDPTLRRR